MSFSHIILWIKKLRREWLKSRVSVSFIISTINYESHENIIFKKITSINILVLREKNWTQFSQFWMQQCPLIHCHFSSKLIPLRTNFISLEQFYVEENVAVFLCSRERHIKFPIRDIKTSENKLHAMKETQRAKINSSQKTMCWGKDYKTFFCLFFVLFWWYRWKWRHCIVKPFLCKLIDSISFWIYNLLWKGLLKLVFISSSIKSQVTLTSIVTK